RSGSDRSGARPLQEDQPHGPPSRVFASAYDTTERPAAAPEMSDIWRPFDAPCCSRWTRQPAAGTLMREALRRSTRATRQKAEATMNPVVHFEMPAADRA